MDETEVLRTEETQGLTDKRTRYQRCWTTPLGWTSAEEACWKSMMVTVATKWMGSSDLDNWTKDKSNSWPGPQ